jgi:hypothetical protein
MTNVKTHCGGQSRSKVLTKVTTKHTHNYKLKIGDHILWQEKV